jgi:hypothetical protein
MLVVGGVNRSVSVCREMCCNGWHRTQLASALGHISGNEFDFRSSLSCCEVCRSRCLCSAVKMSTPKKVRKHKAIKETRVTADLSCESFGDLQV